MVTMDEFIITPVRFFQFNGSSIVRLEKCFDFIFCCFFLLVRTNQHSCNDVNTDCTILLQYTCNDNLRDGQTTQFVRMSMLKMTRFSFFHFRTIPISTNGEANTTFRLTEDLTSYLNCRVRTRNKYLFTADQVSQLKMIDD